MTSFRVSFQASISSKLLISIDFTPLLCLHNRLSLKENNLWTSLKLKNQINMPRYTLKHPGIKAVNHPGTPESALILKKEILLNILKLFSE